MYMDLSTRTFAPNVLAGLVGLSQSSIPASQLLVNLGKATRSQALERTYLDYPNEGLCVLVDGDNIIGAIFLFGAEVEGHQAFSGTLPMLVNFGDKLPAIIANVGSPRRRMYRDLTSRPPTRDKLIYDYCGIELLFEFDATIERLCLVVLQKPFEYTLGSMAVSKNDPPSTK